MRDYKQAIDEMAIVSNTFFSTAFDGRPDRAEFLVGDVLKYLGFADFEIISSKTQVRQSHLLQHDTVADVEVRLKSGEQVLVEVQLSHPERFTPKRGRYLLGSHDIASLKEGMDYSELPAQILIVISEKDLNDSGLPIAVARRRLEETGKLIEDGQTLVYVNYENLSDEDTPINRYIRDLFETDYTKTRSPKARRILEEMKEDQEGRMEFEGRLKEMFDEEVREYRKKIQEYQKKILEYQKENAELQGMISELQGRFFKLEEQVNDLKKKQEM